MKPKILTACFLILCPIWMHQVVYGQTSETVYERLLKTQENYRTALIAGDSAQIAEESYLLGKRYIAVNNYPKAQQWLLKSLSMRKPHGPSESIGKIYLRLSETQVILNHLPEAKKYAHLAHYNFTEANSQKGLSGSYRALGDLERLLWKEKNGAAGSLDSAAYYYRQSEDISVALGDSADLAVTYQCLGLLFDLKNDEVRSLAYYNRALHFFEQKKQNHNIADLSTRVAQNLLSRGDLAGAKKWLDRAQLADTGERRHMAVQESLLRTLADYYERVGEWKKALEYSSQLLAINTQNINNDQQEAMANINLAYENEMAMAEMAAQKKQHVLQKRLTYTLLVLFVGAGIACLLFYILFVKYRRMSRQNALLVKEQSHRTKNNLQSVSDLLSLRIYSLSDPRAIEAMEESLLRVQAMTLVHRSLYQGEELIYIGLHQYIPDLINMVLRTSRHENVKISYEIDPVLLHTDYAVSLGLIVNELTTNACKYAFHAHQAPMLHVSCKVRNNEVVFDFQDNGAGIPSEPVQNKGFGLELIHLLAQRLKGKARFFNSDGCAFSISFKADIKPASSSFKEMLKVS